MTKVSCSIPERFVNPLFEVFDGGDFILSSYRDIERPLTEMRIYFEDAKDTEAAKQALKGALDIVLEDSPEAARDAVIVVEDVPEEDWKFAYRRHFKTELVSPRIYTVPEWEAEDFFGSGKMLAGQIAIVSDPGMAFGSGTHPTTQMLLATLTAMDLDGLTVMDAGCGTGVLGILALKRGAKRVVAYDIDEWSTTNAAENFLLNDFHEVNILLGDASVVRGMTGIDLVLANINRNILLADMPTWVATLSPEGQLLVSGFYEADVLPLVRKATELGMELIEHQHHNEWQMLHFRRA